MDVQISNSMRVTFLVHMIVALVFGVALLLVPGRALTLLGWVPEQVQVQAQGTVLTAPGTTFVDPVVTRLLGAALLALGYASFLGWRASRREQVSLLIQTEFVFCVLGVAAVLMGWYKLFRPMPVVGWVILAILVIFAVAWGLALRRK